MPYISPMSVKRIQDEAAATNLASSLARTTLDDPAPSSESSNSSSNNEPASDPRPTNESHSNSTNTSDSQPTEAAPESEVIEVESETAAGPVEPREAITDSSDSTSTAISRSGSLTPDAPSLISCATGSSSSIRTLSSSESEGLEVVNVAAEAEGQKYADLNPHSHHHEIAHTDCADLRDVDVDKTAPELAHYHRGIYAFTKEMYDRAKLIANRRKARSQGRVRVAPQRTAWL